MEKIRPKYYITTAIAYTSGFNILNIYNYGIRNW